MIYNEKTGHTYKAVNFEEHGWQFALIDGDNVIAIMSLGGCGSQRSSKQELFDAVIGMRHIQVISI